MTNFFPDFKAFEMFHTCLGGLIQKDLLLEKKTKKNETLRMSANERVLFSTRRHGGLDNIFVGAPDMSAPPAKEKAVFRKATMRYTPTSQFARLLKGMFEPYS